MYEEHIKCDRGQYGAIKHLIRVIYRTLPAVLWGELLRSTLNKIVSSGVNYK